MRPSCGISTPLPLIIRHPPEDSQTGFEIPADLLVKCSSDSLSFFQ